MLPRRAIVDDVPDSDPNSGEDAREDAVWRELVARFDSPLAAQEPVPWPEREEMTPAVVGTTATAPAPAPVTGTEKKPAEKKPAETADDIDHFVPPPPPPLPKLDSVTKFAWLALFGGPGYLLLATAARWSMPGLFVFIAVAAFVAGVALLVFRLNDSDRDDSDGDSGAVVLSTTSTWPTAAPARVARHRHALGRRRRRGRRPGRVARP
jgi:hypothetical protein